MKDGSFLVVTPSSIPNSVTRRPNADLSFEGSEKVLEDSNDESTMKKMISNSNEEEGDDHEAEAIDMYFLYLLSFPFIFYHCLLLSSPFYIYIYITF